MAFGRRGRQEDYNDVVRLYREKFRSLPWKHFPICLCPTKRKKSGVLFPLLICLKL